MLLVSYDISDDKVRTKFSKYLRKFGYRLQFSIFEIENSKKILDNVITEINTKYLKVFSEKDSVIIFQLSQQCKKHRFGYAIHDQKDLLIIK